jgi:hypothetical protein
VSIPVCHSAFQFGVCCLRLIDREPESGDGMCGHDDAGSAVDVLAAFIGGSEDRSRAA